jgi:hypothetical protein
MSKLPGRWMRAHGQINSEMPLRQYFLFVGGALLTLLFAANWLMPLPASSELINSDVKLPVIRIDTGRSLFASGHALAPAGRCQRTEEDGRGPAANKPQGHGSPLGA